MSAEVIPWQSPSHSFQVVLNNLRRKLPHGREVVVCAKDIEDLERTRLRCGLLTRPERLMEASFLYRFTPYICLAPSLCMNHQI